MDFIPNNEDRWIYHLIFLRIPKNASTSLYHHLGRFNLIHKYREMFLDNLKKPLYKSFFDPTHAKPDEIQRILPLDPQSYFSFAVVRNPWDRFVSMYSFSKKLQIWKMYGFEEEPSFDQFCRIVEEKFEEQDPYFFPTQDQSLWLEGSFSPSKILRFENLKEEFAQMVKEINAHHISAEIPHENKSSHDHYKIYYNESSMKLVEKIFQRDIETFKYIF